MLLLAATLPWTMVNYQGHFSFTPFDLTRSSIDRSATSALDFQKGDFSSLVQNIYAYAAFWASVLFYLMSVIFIAISVPNTRHRNTFLAPGAAFAIVAAGACIYGVESIKMQIIEDSRTNGPLAQLASGFIGSTITIGIGTYLVCAGGIIALIFNFVRGQFERKIEYQHISGNRAVEKQISFDSPSPERRISDEPMKTLERPAQPPSINRIVYKSSGTAALLAFIGAIFGLPGIGHIYVGGIGRGLLILFSGFVLYVFSWLSVVGGFFGGLLGTAASRSSDAGLSIFQSGLGLGVFLWFAYIALLIWQIFNARSLAKKLNESIQLTGKEPW